MIPTNPYKAFDTIVDGSPVYGRRPDWKFRGAKEALEQPAQRSKAEQAKLKKKRKAAKASRKRKK